MQNRRLQNRQDKEKRHNHSHYIAFIKKNIAYREVVIFAHSEKVRIFATSFKARAEAKFHLDYAEQTRRLE